MKIDKDASKHSNIVKNWSGSGLKHFTAAGTVSLTVDTLFDSNNPTIFFKIYF